MGVGWRFGGRAAEGPETERGRRWAGPQEEGQGRPVREEGGSVAANTAPKRPTS